MQYSKYIATRVIPENKKSKHYNIYYPMACFILCHLYLHLKLLYICTIGYFKCTYRYMKQRTFQILSAIHHYIEETSQTFYFYVNFSVDDFQNTLEMFSICSLLITSMSPLSKCHTYEEDTFERDVQISCVSYTLKKEVIHLNSLTFSNTSLPIISYSAQIYGQKIQISYSHIGKEEATRYNTSYIEYLYLSYYCL